VLSWGPNALGSREWAEHTFSKPRLVRTLKRLALEEKYLLPTGNKFVIPDIDATVNGAPQGCIVIYHVALCYGLIFPLHKTLWKC